jgi:hypothetical protein
MYVLLLLEWNEAEERCFSCLNEKETLIVILCDLQHR